MVKIVKGKDIKLYQCEECGFKYKKRETAERCQVWCSEHKSCNLDIVKYAIQEPENKKYE